MCVESCSGSGKILRSSWISLIDPERFWDGCGNLFFDSLQLFVFCSEYKNRKDNCGEIIEMSKENEWMLMEVYRITALKKNF